MPGTILKVSTWLHKNHIIDDNSCPELGERDTNFSKAPSSSRIFFCHVKGYTLLAYPTEIHTAIINI